MSPRFVTLAAFTVVGLKRQVSPMSGEIPALWQAFGPRIHAVPHAAEPHTSYGVMDHFDAAAGRLDYLAGVSVTQVDELPDGMAAWTVPANTYAVFDTPLSGIGETFGHIFERWLPTAATPKLPAPYFERYGASFDPGDPRSMIEIYIAVQRAEA